jgi:hypothetical protein
VENQQLVSTLNDNAPARWSVLVKNFLAKSSVTIPHTLLPWLQLIFTCSPTEMSIGGTVLL